MASSSRSLWFLVAVISVAFVAACGGRNESVTQTLSESPSVQEPNDVEPTDPAAAGLVGCGEVPASADDSLSVGVVLPVDLTVEAPIVTVKAMTQSVPAAVRGKTRVQGVDAAGRVVTSDSYSDANFPFPVDPVPRDLPAQRSADVALLPCPGADESDVTGYIGIVQEQGGDRLWVSDPQPPPHAHR